MKIPLLKILCCPVCQNQLAWHAFEMRTEDEIQEGFAWCEKCHHFYPIEDTLLELLPPPLAYQENKKAFWLKYNLQKQGLLLEDDRICDVTSQKKQQDHFDWYTSGENYHSYESLPFWQAVDTLTFADWLKQVKPGKKMLDVGCAQGRSTFKFMDMGLDLVGFDISKSAIRQAIHRYRSKNHKAAATFFCADAARLPFLAQTFDYVLIYGVLHHLPNPAETCRQVMNILKPGGLFFGSENNQTIFRSLFDRLMKWKPLWFEEAGAQPLISAQQLHKWFAGMRLQTKTHVFVPPHVVNVLGKLCGFKLLQWTDWLGKNLPFIRENGGLIQCCAKKLD